MNKIDVFGDDRKIPKLNINMKIVIDDLSVDELKKWNRFFGNVMKKPRNKLDFITTTAFRDLDLNRFTATNISRFLNEEDAQLLDDISDIFDNKISKDLKAFILAVLHIPTSL